MASTSQEGTAKFTVKGLDKTCLTWYKIFGDIHSKKRNPLIVAHGGPCACHGYLLILANLNSKFDIPVIFYDQLGGGKSTRLPEKSGDEQFWTPRLFCDELDNLIDHLDIRTGGFDLFGHSWGGMFGSEYATGQPRGLRKLIIADAPASMQVWLEGIDQLRKQLPKDVQDVLNDGEQHGKMDTPEYEAALEVFYKRHLCRVEPWPAKEVQQALEHMMGDSDIYGTMSVWFAGPAFRLLMLIG